MKTITLLIDIKIGDSNYSAIQIINHHHVYASTTAIEIFI